MCGIIGYSGYFDSMALRSAVGALAHRGPDDSGTFEDHTLGVGLAHVRLSILDLSPLGHQPMLSDDREVALVFNGEIYNFRQLRSELEDQGMVFKGQSDSEVVLNLYLAQGEAMLSRLNGIFALAVWDRRRRSFLLARDALGVKPLYFAACAQGVAFASEIKALLLLMPEVRELDIAALHRYLSFLWCPGEGTPLKAVRKLLPGEAMEMRAGRGRIERRWTWYQLPWFRGIRPDLNEASALDGAVSHLRRAVHRQLVADVPVGAFLSGGLDSSAVVAFAREVDPGIRCFTIEVSGGPEDGVTDDLPYAHRVASHLGVPLDVITVDAGRMAGDLENMVAQLDEPLADPAPLNVLYISQLAREQGMKVLLSGGAGDDLFTGYRRHRAVALDRYRNWLSFGVWRGLERASARLDQRKTWARRITKLVNGAGLEGDNRLVNYFRWMSESSLRALYSPGFLAQLTAVDAAEPMLEFLASLPSQVTPLERMLALEQRFFLADHNLIYTDKMSMAVGVEVRVPFLDPDLVDFAARIPTQYKQRGSVGKWVLKQAMEPFLPRDVIYRPKTGFGAPIRRWMRHELRDLVGDLLSPASLKRRGLFDPTAVQRLISENLQGRVEASYVLLSLLCVEIWCRRFVDHSEG